MVDEEVNEKIAGDLEKQKELIMRNVYMAETFTAPWHKNITRWRDLYKMDHYKNEKRAKSGETRFNDPTYTNTIDLTVGIFQANEMRWKVAGWTPGDIEQKRSSAAEKFLKAIIDVNSEREEYDIFYEVDLHFSRDGGAILYTVWDNEIEEDNSYLDSEPNEKGESGEMRYITEVPHTMRVIDPMRVSMYPGGSGNRWACIVRKESMSVYDVESTYGITLKKYANEKATLSDKLETHEDLIDYWDVQYEFYEEDGKRKKKKYMRNAVLFADEFILPPRKMDGYSGYPYDIGFYKPTSRDNSGEWNSGIQPMETTVRLLERSVNRRQRQIDLYSDLPLVSKTQNGRPVVMDAGIGKTVGLTLEESLGFPAWIGNPPDVDKQMELLRSRIQQSGFSDIMFGSGASNVSGYALSQLGDQNRIRLEQPITHLNALWSRWAKKVLKMTTAFAPDACINVYGKLNGQAYAEKVYGKDLEGLHVLCEIKPQFPNEMVRNVAMATQMKGLGVSLETIMQEYINIQQPSDERRRTILEAAQNSPAMLQYLLMAEFKEMADSGDETAKVLLQSLAQQAALTGAGGRPVEPNNAEQPLGLQSSTGGASPQASGNPMPGEGEEDFLQSSANASPDMSGGVM